MKSLWLEGENSDVSAKNQLILWVIVALDHTKHVLSSVSIFIQTESGRR